MALRLLKDKVAIIPIEDPDITPAGLIIPESAKQRVDQGVVKYRGPGVESVRVGDHVVFSSYSGSKITVSDEGYLYIMDESDIQAILTDGASVTMVPLFTVERIIQKAWDLSDSPDDLIGQFKSLIYAEGYEF